MQILIQQVWGEACDAAVLTKLLVDAQLLVLEHFEQQGSASPHTHNQGCRYKAAHCTIVCHCNYWE